MTIQKSEQNINLKWCDLVEQISISFRLNPDRIALIHLGAYLIASKGGKKASLHSVNDDNNILDRLEQINTFKDGD